jgi:sugar lactone lactonase YvrE
MPLESSAQHMESDGSRLYHCDARADIIRVYDVYYDGAVSLWRVFARIEGGTPDGMAVASPSSRPTARNAHASQSYSSW